MATPLLSFKAVFPAPVAVPELGLALGPATLCHLAALDLLRCEVLDGNFGPAAITLAAYVLALPSGDVESLVQAPAGAEALRRDAALWAQQVPVSAMVPLRAGVLRCVTEAFETAITPANPTAEGQPARTSAGPSK